MTASLDFPPGLDGAEFLALVESAPQFVALARVDNRVAYVNPAGRALVGLDSLEEACSHPIAAYLTDEGLRASLEVEQPAVVRDGAWHGRSSLRHFKTGEEIPVEISSFTVQDSSGETIMLATFQRDLRDQLLLEERLRGAQRLEAVGRLAGAVAHDFNNLLMVILGFSQVIADNADLPAATRRHGQEILKAAGQGSEITRQLLTLARDSGDRDTADLNAVISDNVSLLHRLAGETVECVVRLTPRRCVVPLDQTQLMQILLNLCANARDAMPGGGSVEIATERVDGPIGVAHGERHVVVRVADSGSGIPGEVLSDVLEPFFTTKADRGGTGLGLASVAEIARGAGGDVLVDSVPGHGTTVSVVLPLLDDDGPQPGEATPRAAVAGSETILLVENDPAVAEILRLALQAEGYAIERATDGGEALRRFEEGAPDLMIADLTLPGLRGDELAASVQARLPELPVILISGQAAPVPAAEGSGRVEFMAKPFLPTDLLACVRSLLDGR